MDCYCYDEPADVYDEKIVRARKEHICCECGRKINPKDIYLRIKMLYDGSWSSYSQCGRCMVVFEVVNQEGGCPLVEGLFEAISESYHNYSEGVQNYLKKTIPDAISWYWFEEENKN